MNAPLSTALLSARELVKVYGHGHGFLHRTAPPPAVDRVSFDIMERETLALVGESGSGKSTIGRLVMQLDSLTSGSIHFEGERIDGLEGEALRAVKRKMQIVFQDPYGALNPRMRIGEFICEPWVVHGLHKARGERQDRAAALLERVGLHARFMNRYPHEFSGGQRQRICIARAIALQPKLIVADEPITALDVSIQAQIMNLFQDLRDEAGIAYLFIAHDLSMVRSMSHRVAVMYRGRIVEMGPTAAVFGQPRHPYTRSLLSAVPIPDPDIEKTRKRTLFDASRPLPHGATLVEVAPRHVVLQDA